MNKNSENPKIGKEFEKVVKEWAELYPNYAQKREQ